MSYQNFPNQSSSAGLAGGVGAPYLGASGVPNSGGYPNPGGYPGGYPNVGPGGYPNPGNAAYDQGYYYHLGRDPNALDKSRLVVLLLAWFFGIIGVHHFHVGRIGSRVTMIFMFGGLGIWTFVDIIMIAAGSFIDIDGRPVTVWDTAN